MVSRTSMGERPDPRTALSPVRTTVPLTGRRPTIGLNSIVSRASSRGSTGTGGVFLVAEEIGDVPDEAYAKVVMELSRALQSRSSVAVHLTPTLKMKRSSRSSARRRVRRMRAIASRKLWSEIRRARPQTLVYVSRSSATLAALVRSKLLRLMAGRARIVMIGLQPRVLGGRGRFLARFLWPDLLLVSTEAEVGRARALGARASRMVTGVDLARFRPSLDGEKHALRRKWGVPPDARVVLHVGHLTSGRNIEALIPIAAEPGFTVVMVASSQQDKESEGLEQELRANGVIVIRGFLPDIDEIYRLADCYAFPTISSDHAIAMPLSILEAMATGLPIASMRFGVLQERFAEVEGIVLVDDQRALKAAVLRLVHAPTRTRQLAQAYSWDAVAQHVTDLT